MANKRKNLIKSVLDLDAQPEKEPILPVEKQEIEEIQESVVNVKAILTEDIIEDLEYNHEVNAVKEITKIVSEELKIPEEELLVEKKHIKKEPIPRTLKSLSRAEFRQFQRTGKLPK